MPARSIDGKPIAEAWRARLAERVEALRQRGIRPCLASVTASADGAWSVYQKNQAKACEQIGIAYRRVDLPAGATQADLSETIEGLNVDHDVHGIIVQSPLREPFSELTVQALLSPDKDVEAVGPANQGLVFSGRHSVAPCTAVAAILLAKEALGDLRGVEAVVVGAGVVVGRPIAQLLLAAGATVTLCHIDTRDLAAHTTRADLLVVAVGRAGLITPALVKPGATVIDVGINRVPGGDGKAKVVGDVDPAVAEVAGALTPVPGGVGSVTTTVLLDATIGCAERLADDKPVLAGETLSRLLGGADLPVGVADRIAELLARHLIHTPGAAATLQTALERRLARGVLVVDGAMGSELIARGIPAAAVTRANLDHPDLVRELHRAYVAAGAEAITANTFAANRYRAGDSEMAVRQMAAGVRLAREVAVASGKQPFVLASLGPLGPAVGVEIPVEEASAAAAEIALAAVDAGADGFVIETSPSTVEARAILAGIRRVSRLPVLASRSIDRDDVAELADFAQAMEQGGATAVGINCAAGPRALAPVVASLAKVTALPILARPNAGFPVRGEGGLTYRLRPAYLVEQMRAYVASGAGIIGGCCGVGPDHIAALATALAGAPLAQRQRLTVAPSEPASAPRRHPLLDLPFPILAFAPGRLSPQAASAALGRCAACGCDAVGLLNGWPGSARGSRLSARLRHLADGVDRPAVLEVLSGCTSLAQAQDQLLAAHLVGVRLILIDGGVFPGETRIDALGHGADAADLLTLCRRLNEGRDLAGGRLDEACAFTVGVRLPADQVDRAPAYARLGADFLTLQPVYQPARFRALMQRLEVPIPVLAEILLLPDAAVAEELDNELPALSVPPKLKQRLSADPGEDVAGVLRFLAHWRERLAGVCLLIPDERTAAAEAVITAVRKAAAAKA